MKSSNRIYLATVGTATSFVLVAFIARASHVRIITTDSAAPAGIYRTVTASLTRGELVLACLPPEAARLALARGYLGAGDCVGGVEPVAKLIGALPGDTVEIRPAWTAVNGIRFEHSPTLSRDSANRPLTHVAWGMRTVPDQQVWLFGFNNRRSWDSRFFGAVSTGNVRGALEPLIIW
ncbi:MAG: conjugative transfer signal peptidase TraF [Acidobacteria bacterium]|nr:conjugative transfer signal peptidase TraF [Acidobacteriota bacterium]